MDPTDRSVDTARPLVSSIAVDPLGPGSRGSSEKANRFRGQVCLITGGARGIGRRLAEAIASDGGYVGIMARTASECHDVADALGDVALALPGDVTDSATCASLVETLSKHFGCPDFLVNAAGVSPIRARAELHEAAAFEEITRINLGGAYHMTRAVAPGMLGRGRGSILMIASVLALSASPRLVAYGASKAGLVQMTKTLAREWGERGVRVNALCPGYVRTSLTAGVLEHDHLRREIVGQTALRRLPSLDEIIEPGLFLLSDAASYVTGVALAVDGGMST